MTAGGRNLAQNIGLVIGPVISLLMIAFGAPDGLPQAGWNVAALMALMACWWATEAIPIPATSLLPLVILPLIGAASIADASKGYADKIVLLLLGGFIVAMGIEKWNLHERIALWIVSLFGHQTRLIVIGFMWATALISAWISNSATTLMMVPIAISVAASVPDKSGKFASALLLGICYAASIGGVATPMGTPTNLIAKDWLEKNAGASIDFLTWMAFGVPAMLILVPVAWLVVTRGMSWKPSQAGEAARREIGERLAALGSMRSPEARAAMVFAVVATLWVVRGPFQEFLKDENGKIAIGWIASLNDTTIAMFGAVLMFLVPAGSGEKRALLNWEEAERLPWGVLLLFGGGISLGQAVSRTGLSEWIGQQLGIFAGAPGIVIIFIAVALVIYLTELTSNVATMTTLAPILGAFATAIGLAPESLLAPAAVAASCAFMLPVATAPNAIVFATGQVRIGEMIRAGFWINLIGVFVVTAIGYYLAPLVL